MFQIKDFASIVASQINWMKSTQTQITDFNEGSIVRTLIEAPATELDQLYQQMLNGLIEAISVAVYNSFGFPALTATSAGGLVAVSIAAQPVDVTIPAGSSLTPTTGAQIYSSTADVVIPMGSTSANVPVSANTPGTAGNIPNGTVFAITPLPAGFTTATIVTSFINGTDDETDAEHLVRFNSYISTLQRGTNDAISYGAKTAFIADVNGNVIEKVATAVVDEPFVRAGITPISNIFCYVHNGIGSTSGALVSQAQLVVNGYIDANNNRIKGWKAAGVVCTVVAATEQALSVTGVLTAAPGFDKPTLVAAARSVITAYILSVPIGQAALLNPGIVTSVTSIPGVANFVLSTPSGDTSAAFNVKIMPGAISIT